ncbi:MAG: hypothetical protein K2G70_07605 [Turicibacter sp.]|nr:hypothetical protein [Turicibacter sp.]
MSKKETIKEPIFQRTIITGYKIGVLNFDDLSPIGTYVIKDEKITDDETSAIKKEFGIKSFRYVVLEKQSELRAIYVKDFMEHSFVLEKKENKE